MVQALRAVDGMKIIALLLAFGLIGIRCDASPVTIGGIAPHHMVAEKRIVDFYEQISAIAPKPKRVILLGPDHFNAGKTPITLCGSDWETPSGTLRSDAALRDFLLESHTVSRQDDIFPREHSITVHIPFIRQYLGNAVILPMIIQSRATDIQILTLRKQLLSFLQEGGVLLLSMDFSHYKTSDEADAEDVKSLASIKNFTVKRGLDIDCPRGTALFLGIMKDLGTTNISILGHTNSGKILGNRDAPSTSYFTLVFFQ